MTCGANLPPDADARRQCRRRRGTDTLWRTWTSLGSTCPGRGPRRSPTSSTRRAFFEPSYDDRDWELVACPGTGARTRRSPSDGPLLHRRWFDSPDDGAGRTACAAGSCSTASSTWATSGSTAPTSVTPRATSSHTSSTSPSICAGRAEHLLAIEVACARQIRSHREAQHDRRLPALGLHRSRLEPRRHLAAGPARANGAGPDQPVCGCCAARPTPTPTGRSSRSSPTSTATRPAR